MHKWPATIRKGRVVTQIKKTSIHPFAGLLLWLISVHSAIFYVFKLILKNSRRGFCPAPQYSWKKSGASKLKGFEATGFTEITECTGYTFEWMYMLKVDCTIATGTYLILCLALVIHHTNSCFRGVGCWSFSFQVFGWCVEQDEVLVFMLTTRNRTAV